MVRLPSTRFVRKTARLARKRRLGITDEPLSHTGRQTSDGCRATRSSRELSRPGICPREPGWHRIRYVRRLTHMGSSAPSLRRSAPGGVGGQRGADFGCPALPISRTSASHLLTSRELRLQFRHLRVDLGLCSLCRALRSSLRDLCLASRCASTAPRPRRRRPARHPSPTPSRHQHNWPSLYCLWSGSTRQCPDQEEPLQARIDRPSTGYVLLPLSGTSHRLDRQLLQSPPNGQAPEALRDGDRGRLDQTGRVNEHRDL